jgi:pyridoxamine 5'-phosphate oxidase
VITFSKIEKSKPYSKLYEYYLNALEAGQENIEAILIASYSIKNKEVDSRYVNLKIIKNDQFIFFSNYNSPKAADFKDHSQISSVLYWPKINVQIRMKSNISKVPNTFSDKYFLNRDVNKNALAISSSQSKTVKSYDQVLENYNRSLKNNALDIRPDYWGGYSFTPYYFEFWEGRSSRLNKRDAYKKNADDWCHFILQP